MNNAKSFQPTPIIFSIGMTIGLAFGLLIGWVLWPVEWQGATLRDLDTAGKAEYIASVADAFVIYDSPEAAAIAQQRLASLQPTDLDTEFVAAIRYFQSSAQPERAIRISNIGRLATSLGMVPPDLQASATNSQITTNDNIDQTASDTTNSTAAETSANPATAASSGTTDSTSSGAIVAWLRWLLWLVAALLLLGGGLYLMSAAGIFDWQQWLTVRYRALGKRSTIDEFDDYDYNEATSAKQPSERPSGRRNTFVTETEDLAFENDDAVVDRWRYEPSAPSTLAHDNLTEDGNGDEDDFEEEAEVDDGFSSAQRNDNTQWKRPHDKGNPAYFTAENFPSDPPNRERTNTPVEPQHDNDSDKASGRHSFTSTELAIRNPLDADDDELNDGTVLTVDSIMANVTNRSSAVAPLQTTAEKKIVHELEDDFDDDDFDDDFGDDDFDDELESGEERTEVNPGRTGLTQAEADAIRNRVKQASLPAPRPSMRPPEQFLPRPSTRTPQQPAAPKKHARHKLIDQHTLQYQMGISEYDESKPIVDPSSGKYIGEFGMGTSSKNGMIQPKGEYIAALEVWLFDKSDEKNMGNQTRILLSEYAVDHNLEQAFIKERRDNPRSFTPQPNVHFQLESQNLLLDCTIVDVEYLNSGDSKGMFQRIKVDMSVHQK